MVEQVSGLDDHLARMALVARGLTASLRPHEVIDIVVRQGMAGLGAEGGVLALVAPDGVVVPVETVGYAKETVAAFAPMSVGQDLPLTVAVRDAEPIWVPSRADAASRFPSLLGSAASDSQAWAAIPLVADDSVIGVLGVSFLAPHDFSEPERLFIRALGDQCALALTAHRSQRASTRAGVEKSVLSDRRRRRAHRDAAFPITTLVVRRRPDATADVADALRDDARFTVNECDDHDALVDLMRNEPFDLVIVSSDLQAASRVQIADLVRAEWPQATLVLLTGDPGVEEQARRLGANAVFGLAMPAGLLRAALVALVDPGPDSTVDTAVETQPGPTADSTALDAGSLDAHTLSSAMFARSLDAVLFTAPDGQIIAANPAACRMLGLSEEGIRERGRSGLADPTDPRWATGLRERESTGQFFGELSMLRGDGSAFPAEVSSAVFKNEFAELRTVVVFRDITDRKPRHHESQAARTDEDTRDKMVQTLMEVAVRRLWAVGLSLQGGLQGPPDRLIVRAQAAIDELDDTIRELRRTLLSDT